MRTITKLARERAEELVKLAEEYEAGRGIAGVVQGLGRRQQPGGGLVKRNWTDLRDGLVWEIEATPVQPQMGDGEPSPINGETVYTLRFSSQGGGVHRLVVDPDVGSRLGELSDAELAGYLDEASSGGQL